MLRYATTLPDCPLQSPSVLCRQKALGLHRLITRLLMAFAVFFTSRSCPIPASSFVQTDATHWVRTDMLRSTADGPAAAAS